MGIIKPYRSFYLTTFLFWISLSIPRIVYICEIGAFTNELGLGIFKILILGFLRDALIISPLFICFNLYHNLGTPLSKPAVVILFGSYCWLLSTIFFLGLGNAQFIRFYGSNFNLIHLDLVRQTEEGLRPYLSDLISMKKIMFYVFLYFAAFVIFFFSSSFRFELLFRQKKALRFFAVIFIISWTVTLFPQENPALTALTENTTYDVIRKSIFHEELRGTPNEPVNKVFDSYPYASEYGKDNEWYYFSKKYPLAKATGHQLCQMGIWPITKCNQDNDGDKYPLQTDCNDNNNSVYPHALDIPRNGIDEDCSGIDADPPNVIFIHWEGARAVNVGSIGYSTPSTPEFDALAKNGVLFSNVRANAARTRWSLISIYTSILPRMSPYYIFKYKPELNLLAFPLILKKNGYKTIYLHSGWINYSGKRKRIQEWFEVLYDQENSFIKNIKRVSPWGIDDKDLFNLAYELLKKREDSRPFYMSLVTVSNHYPFTLPEKKFELADHQKKENQIPNVMHYSDHYLGKFVNKILADPQLENTIILIAGDHGNNWYSPHPENNQTIMWDDMMWVPLLLAGKNWNHKPETINEIRQLADIGPTILDRLGIEVPNPFIGHSLLRRTRGRNPRTFFSSSEGHLGAGVHEGDFKYSIFFKPGKEYLYNLKNDPKELSNLADDTEYLDLANSYYGKVTNAYTHNTTLINENRIWNPTFDKIGGQYEENKKFNRN